MLRPKRTIPCDVHPNAAVTIKQPVCELIDQLPDHATWREIACQVALRTEGENRLADVGAGRGVDGDDVLRWIDSWGNSQKLASPLRVS